MINEFLRAFALIFIAEMGDKSQIIAMTFATQYLLKDVILGVTLGVVFNHAIAIILGTFISTVIPTTYIQIIAGFLFIIFGLNSLSIGGEENITNKKEFSPIATVAIAFFIGELGDKTQLATMTLAAESVNPLIVLMGTSLAMVTTSLLGIFIGSKVGERIPEISVKIVSSLVFLTFGVIRVLSTTSFNSLLVLISLIILASVEILLIKRILKVGHTPKKDVSKALYEKIKLLKKSVDSICLTESECGSCIGVGCLLGYIRYIIKQSKDSKQYYDTLVIDIDKLIRKNYDSNKVLDALIIILKDYNENNWVTDEDFVVNKIKSTLETMLFNTKIDTKNIIQYKKKVESYDKNIGDIIDANL